MSLPHSTDHPQISLAYLPPTPRQTRIALVAAAVLLLGLVVSAPFAAIPLPRVSGFIPALNATIFIADSITASLFFAHFSITRSRAILALSCGFFLTALTVVVHGLTFPFDSSLPQLRINFRLFLLWHLGLPVALIFYVWLRNIDRSKGGVRTPTVVVAISSVAGVLALASCLAWLAHAGDEILPLFLSGLDRSGPVAPLPNAVTILICAAALLVMWAFRRSVLDQWLMVLVLASTVEPVLSLFGSTRFALGFYAGRGVWLVASVVVLILLLAETTRLYAAVTRANILASILNASHTLSSEIELPRLIERLMKIAIEYAGASRGLLVLPSGDEYLVRAVAHGTGDQIETVICQEPITRILCPESLVRHVIRTRENVILDDASKPGQFSGDDYLRDHQSKSILCLPLIKQRELTGILVLENATTSNTFTPARIAALELLAAQAAISLENTRLYRELQEREGRVRRLFSSNIIGIFTWNLDGRILDANYAFGRIIGYESDDLMSGQLRWKDLMPPEWDPTNDQIMTNMLATGVAPPFEAEYVKKDGSRVPVLIGAALFDGTPKEGVAFVLDLTDRRRAEQAARDSDQRYHDIERQLSEANRIASIAQLSATIAHEINQPLSGIITNASTGLRLLDADPPNIEGARETSRRAIRDGNSATDVIARLRALFSSKEIVLEPMDLNEATREVIALTWSELEKNGVVVQTELAQDLPSVGGDRIQLQQVILNLLRNASAAMAGVHDRPRRVVISTGRDDDVHVRLAVRDTGAGLDPEGIDKLFTAFYTTTNGGMGVGLSISRSIIERHHGRLWAEPNDDQGATFAFSIPCQPASLQ